MVIQKMIDDIFPNFWANIENGIIVYTIIS